VRKASPTIAEAVGLSRALLGWGPWIPAPTWHYQAAATNLPGHRTPDGSKKSFRASSAGRQQEIFLGVGRWATARNLPRRRALRGSNKSSRASGARRQHAIFLGVGRRAATTNLPGRRALGGINKYSWAHAAGLDLRTPYDGPLGLDPRAPSKMERLAWIHAPPENGAPGLAWTYASL